MRQVSEFNENVVKGAKQYVSAYLRDDATRQFHLQFMRDCECSGFAYLQEMVDCIDVLLWEHDQQQALDIPQEMDAWAADHEHWSAIQ